ncbi:MAG: transcription termination/antitermination protein NusA [candidate division Zixibacteria bacterium]|nr:transcription termination/antitermination protein NusA [candidate division Zixibacteria bacterium]
MSDEILDAFGQIARDKNIGMEYVVGTIEAALQSAAKRKFGTSDNISVEVDPDSGEIHIFQTKKVVEKVEDRLLEVSLEEALEDDPETEIGDEIDFEIAFEDFGRNAIAAAKQILIQRVREAEREMIFNEYKDRVGELITGSVQQIDKGNVLVNLGKTEAILPAKEQIYREKYRQGDRIRAIIIDVQRTSKGPQIALSRARSEFLLKLFELEVPEIFEKIIEIKAIAREPGERSKIAVASNDERIDPVGACVGVKGSRVQNIVRELNNERIDIVLWSSQAQVFVTKALAPAKIVNIETFPGEDRMTVVVDDEKLSLAIGKSGQNARLAAKLTGWKINILSETEYRAMKKAEEMEKVDLDYIEGITPKMQLNLSNAGFDTAQDIVSAPFDSLLEVEGIGQKKAEVLLQKAEEAIESRKLEMGSEMEGDEFASDDEFYDEEPEEEEEVVEPEIVEESGEIEKESE